MFINIQNNRHFRKIAKNKCMNGKSIFMQLACMDPVATGILKRKLF